MFRSKSTETKSNNTQMMHLPERPIRMEVPNTYNEKLVGMTANELTAFLDAMDKEIDTLEHILKNIANNQQASLKKLQDIDKISQIKPDKYSENNLVKLNFLKEALIEDFHKQQLLPKSKEIATVVLAGIANTAALREETTNIGNELLERSKNHAKWSEKLAHLKRFLAWNLMKSAQEHYQHLVLNAENKYKNEEDRVRFINKKREQFNKEFSALGIEVNENGQLNTEIVYTLFDTINLQEIAEIISKTLLNCDTAYIGSSEAHKKIEQALNNFANDCANDFTNNEEDPIKNLLNIPHLYTLNKNKFKWSDEVLLVQQYIHAKCKAYLSTEQNPLKSSFVDFIQAIETGKKPFVNNFLNLNSTIDQPLFKRKNKKLNFVKGDNQKNDVVSKRKKTKSLNMCSTLRQKVKAQGQPILNIHNVLVKANNQLDFIQKECSDYADQLWREQQDALYQQQRETVLTELKEVLKNREAALIEANKIENTQENTVPVPDTDNIDNIIPVIVANNSVSLVESPSTEQPEQAIKAPAEKEILKEESEAEKLCALIKNILLDVKFWNAQLKWGGGDQHTYTDSENNKQTIKLPKGITEMLLTIELHKNSDNPEQLLKVLKNDANKCLARPDSNISNYLKYSIFGVRTEKTTQAFYQIINSLDQNKNNYQKIYEQLERKFTKELKEQQNDIPLSVRLKN